MDTPKKPKRKQTLVGIGALLIFGGFSVIRMAGKMGAFYENFLQEESGAWWATGLGWLLIFAGAAALLSGITNHFIGGD